MWGWKQPFFFFELSENRETIMKERPTNTNEAYVPLGAFMFKEEVREKEHNKILSAAPIPKEEGIRHENNYYRKENSLSVKYPHYWKFLGEWREVDVYRVHQLFNIDDPSGRLHHASKKLLVTGGRGGGKSKYKDVKEAYVTLGAWLEDNKHLDVDVPPSVDGIVLTDEELQLLRNHRK